MEEEAGARARFRCVLGDADLVVSRRDGRWLGLGREVVAFAADDAAGWERLLVEGRLLARWRLAGVPAPQVWTDDGPRRVQVRERLDGLTGDAVEPLVFGGPPPDARARFAGASISAFGRRVAASYGELASAIHAAVPVTEAVALGLGPRAQPDLGAALAILRADPSVESATIAAVVRALPGLVATQPATAAIHGDLHFHNLSLAADGSISGVFDLGDAGLDVPETDLQYVHSLGPEFAAIAVGAYRRALDGNAVRRAHLVTALAHVLWHGPGTPRHASILGSIRAAFATLSAR